MKYNMKFLTSDMHSTWEVCFTNSTGIYASLGHSKWDNSFRPDFLSFYIRAGSPLPLTITMNLIICTTHLCERKQCLDQLRWNVCILELSNTWILLAFHWIGQCWHPVCFYTSLVRPTTVRVVCWCTIPVDDAAEIFRVFRIKWHGRLQRG